MYTDIVNKEKNMMISKATLSRIPGYLKHLKELPASVTEISATTLARQLSLGEVQVRKDLASVCGKGKPKIGYKVADLIRSCLLYTSPSPRDS